ncbi:MAG: lipoyl(octanoyl) transferase LipB [Gammaproteobacteria bacterium]|nr:lipoyl(octanoyl) transferase LipB [Gammaproteobacteria bacterium]
MLKVRDLGETDYLQTWERMREFTATRTEKTEDELWLTEHPPVFTLGQAGKQEHLFLEPDIPVVHTDRGGQITYHGPGQVVGYTLVDLKRARVSVHDFVCLLEQAMIDTVGEFGVRATRLSGHPGIYVAGRKIGSLGLRVRRACSYHGISLNVDMDLGPFNSIDPCGIPGMTVTQLIDLAPNANLTKARRAFEASFCALFKSETNLKSAN